jgi:hypothetical protein
MSSVTLRLLDSASLPIVGFQIRQRPAVKSTVLNALFAADPY